MIFHIFAIRIEGKLKIIVVILYPLQLVDHPVRILRPEHKTIHHRRAQINPADHFGIVRIGYQYIFLFNPIEEPFRIESGNIGSSTCAYNHIPIGTKNVPRLLLP